MSARKNDSYVMGSTILIKLTLDHLIEIEKKGRIKLSVSLQKRLQHVISEYQMEANMRENSSPLEAQLTNFNKALECTTFLESFLDPHSEDHSIYGPRSHIEDEYLLSLCSLYIEQKNLYVAALRKALKRFNALHQEIALLKKVTHTAYQKYQEEDEKQKDLGGPNENIPLNEFLLELRKIYDKAKGKKGAYEKFVISIFDILPEALKYKPSFDSIRRQTDRLKNK